MPRLHLPIPCIPRRRARRRRMALQLVLLLIVLLVLLPGYIIYRPPRLLIAYFSHRWPDIVWEVFPLYTSSRDNNSHKLVALTIDDAPSSHTRDILRVLSDNDSRATFFVVGNQVAEGGGREALLEDIVRAGHELGNHGGRDEPARRLTTDELERQILHVQGFIEAAYAGAGRTAPTEERFFRPGSGFFSSSMRRLARKLGYRIVLGGIYPHDAQVGYAWVNARHVLGMVRPGGIIICHDRRSWTVPMLKAVLPELRRRGYRVVGVGELLRAGEEVGREGRGGEMPEGSGVG